MRDPAGAAIATALRARFGGWGTTSVHRRIAAAAGTVAIFTLAAKVAGAGKEVVVAHRFGISDDVDAFVLALAVPAFLINVTAGALQSALMPTYIEQRRSDRGAAQRLLATTMVASVAVLAACAAAFALVVRFLVPLLAPGFGPDKLHSTVQLSLLLAPAIVLAGVSACWGAVLNAHGRFAAPAAAAVATPLTAIAVLVALGRRWGVVSLAVGVVAGYALEALLTGLSLRREGVSLVPRWGGLSAPVRRVMAQYGPLVTGALVLGLNPLVDQTMAARLAPGSVASLAYGAKVVSFALGIGATSLASAVFPLFASMSAAHDWDSLERTMRLYTRALLVATIPVTLVGMLLSNDIVRLLFERGAFTPADTAVVGRIQACYLLQVPFQLATLFYVRFLSAASRNSVLMWISFVNAITNVAGNYVLSAYLGAAGIALSTSVVNMVSFALAFSCARRRLRQLRAV